MTISDIRSWFDPCPIRRPWHNVITVGLICYSVPWIWLFILGVNFDLMTFDWKKTTGTHAKAFDKSFFKKKSRKNPPFVTPIIPNEKKHHCWNFVASNLLPYLQGVHVFRSQCMTQTPAGECPVTSPWNSPSCGLKGVFCDAYIYIYIGAIMEKNCRCDFHFRKTI